MVVWCGLVRSGLVWSGVVWCGLVWSGLVWCGLVWCGFVWFRVVWLVVWCGLVSSVVWCGLVWSGPHHWVELCRLFPRAMYVASRAGVGSVMVWAQCCRLLSCSLCKMSSSGGTEECLHSLHVIHILFYTVSGAILVFFCCASNCFCRSVHGDSGKVHARTRRLSFFQPCCLFRACAAQPLRVGYAF